MKTLKKVGCFGTAVLLSAIMLCGCGKETYMCGYCMRTVTQKPHSAKILGQEIKLCESCYETLDGLQTQLK